MTSVAATHTLSLRPGDLVEVRAAQEILATLDERGELDNLPFMPEMIKFCGRRLRVDKRSDKTCDTINYQGNRRMHNTVHLRGLRCDGGAHGGCQAACLVHWKEAWLKRVDGGVDETPDESTVIQFQAPPSQRYLGEWRHLEAFTRQTQTASDGETRYSCQATELLRASTPMAWWDPRQYWRDVRSGNVTVSAVVRAALFRCFLQLLKVGGYNLLIASYNRLQAWRGDTPYPFLAGNLTKTPRETLDLQPGELVQVKSQQEILQTVDNRRRNRGLSFDPEMVRYCGGTYRVIARVERIIEERTGRLIKLPNDCVILGGVYCRAEYSDKRLFCPRSLYPFWREIWLRRSDGAQVAPAPSAVGRSCASP